MGKIIGIDFAHFIFLLLNIVFLHVSFICNHPLSHMNPLNAVCIHINLIHCHAG